MSVVSPVMSSVISAEMAQNIEKGSVIRQMFELGITMKQEFGVDAVMDFSLGNPDLPPPLVIHDAMRELAGNLNKPGSLGYMPNAGYAWALEALAEELSKEQNIKLTKDDVMLSCGAAGAINAFLHSVLEPQDEVIAIAPFFGEYRFYVTNHNGVFKSVMCDLDSFGPDCNAIEKAINAKTRVLIINSPNNPTGKVYSEEELRGIVAILEKASKKYGRPIYLLSDEPYRFLAYDNLEVPPVLPLYKYAVVVGSFSKKYGIAGERIGYLAVSPALEDKKTLLMATSMSNRVLGFVNPPVVGQYLMKAALGTSTSKALAIYTKRRDIFVEILREAGLEFQIPQGAFYIFPKAPNGDDEGFVKALREEKILGVSGQGFGCKGYIRLCYAVEDHIIAKSREGFKRAVASMKKA